MAHEKYTHFEAKVLSQGGSNLITIPKPCANYIGIMVGDTVSVKINRVRRPGTKV